MGSLCCSDKEGKVSYSIDATNPIVGKVRLKIDRNFLKDNGIEDPPEKVKVLLPKVKTDSQSPTKQRSKIRLGRGRIGDNHIVYLGYN